MERKFAGILLLLVGAVLAFGTLGVVTVSVAYLWPLFMLVPGIMFHVTFFSNPKQSRSGLLVPGGVLIVYGLLFLFCNIFGWDSLENLWPVFLIGPSVGLFESYLFGSRQPGLLIPASILMVLALLFLGFNVLSGLLGGGLGVVLVLAGLWVLFGRGVGKSKSESFFKQK
ncbi:LiaI-LiaF-like domain-containing protein [Tumebacillus permanentifrigoris]|uniref:LiaI-LiaF-like transmembrane region domain-containing protein n=1 Tax=Tumebacillus permanentifrigoris TaxID=378543 RepID=A0A316D5R7_9BACL|nr:DUF5668 domain-containing protein [Tumebacillus permanentifrigoris]PWK09586.1 hypothetical protein C7459_11320 [Tumebacillus permanentifrigoris]